MIFKPNIIKRLTKYDEMLDQKFSILRAYLYFTLTQTISFTIGGFVFGALLGARNFILQHDNQKLSDAYQQTGTNDIKEPFFQINHTRINGRRATQREIKSLNLIFCSLFSSYESAKIGFKVGSTPIRYPLQHAVDSFTSVSRTKVANQPR